MCVILYKPAGVDLPGTRTLRNCFSTNPDGAGLMVPDGHGGVQVIKGLMTFGALTRALERYAKRDVPLVVHFRIGTQGANSPELTHPFPVTRSDKALSASHTSAPVALAHNGIISLTCDYTSEHSDTYLFVRDYVTGVINGPRWYRNREAVDVLEALAKSKLAIMSADGHVELVGSFEKHDGCFYSNGSYRGWSAYGLPSSAAYSQPALIADDGYLYEEDIEFID